MFSIFKKKYFLADYLSGLIDMHCHLLPGMDDGSVNNAMSLEMIKKYKELGYEGAIATPHMMDGMYGNNSEKIIDSLNSFKLMKAEKGYENFSVDAAAEYMLDQGFDNLLKTNDFLIIHGRSVLVEMSYFQRNMYVETQIFNLQQHGFEPILAHPERYFYLTKPEHILEFQLKGCDLQLNILSLSGHYGPAIYKQALFLLMNDHYDYLGTDAHKPEHLEKIKGITISKKMIPFIESLVARTKENMKEV